MSTLTVPDARLHHELRGTGSLVALVGAPMDADAFAPLAEILAADHTVLTADPRGVHRSRVADPDADSTPEQRADDLAALIAHADAGPAAVLGSSGGAVTALALAERHPALVRTVIAHEPPLDEMLPDRAELRERTDAMCRTYLDGDVVGAWSEFFALADIAMPPGAVEEWFGGERDPRQVADERFWFAHELRPSVRFVPDVEALRHSRIVVGIGRDSAGQLCDRACRALAERLAVEPVLFPGGHTGFADDPTTFAPALKPYL
ncbi:alpha/beta fold hydrolase [Pseudonocardia pini]|uniref:alpha/beta fold hydrolase n=1 Tax=Pseudonocardia pini TaxID=2758030 RepID=UPI0015F1200C|nr:alpha/beta hydrolase [Pseudonocardia pini]